MKKKPKLDDVDVVFDSTPLTNKERKLISDYILSEKNKMSKKKRGQKQATPTRLAYR